MFLNGNLFAPHLNVLLLHLQLSGWKFCQALVAVLCDVLWCWFQIPQIVQELLKELSPNQTYPFLSFPFSKGSNRGSFGADRSFEASHNPLRHWMKAEDLSININDRHWLNSLKSQNKLCKSELIKWSFHSVLKIVPSKFLKLRQFCYLWFHLKWNVPPHGSFTKLCTYKELICEWTTKTIFILFLTISLKVIQSVQIVASVCGFIKCCLLLSSSLAHVLSHILSMIREV